MPKRLTFQQRALRSGLDFNRGQRGPTWWRYAPRPLYLYSVEPKTMIHIHNADHPFARLSSIPSLIH